MPHLDIFNDDAFTMMELTTAINKLPFQPQQIGAMNLFSQKPHTTKRFSVEELHGKLSLIPAEARGSRPTKVTRGPRVLRPFETVHLPQDSAVLADEVSGVRAFGSETEVEAVSKIVNDHLENHKRNIEVTKEWQRIGAIQGVVYDADGATVIQDLFDTFSITPITGDIDFAAPPEMKTYSSAIIRAMEDALGADVYSGILAICGNAWWDSLIVMDEVKTAYDRWQSGQFLRDNQLRQGFEFANIHWINYRGSVGSQKFLADDQCRFIPLGVRDLFEEHQAPAPFMETVNTRAKPFYSKQERMPLDLGVEIFSCADVLMICTRPQVLISSTGTNLETGGGVSMMGKGTTTRSERSGPKNITPKPGISGSKIPPSGIPKKP